MVSDDKQGNVDHNTREIMIYDYIKQIHPEHFKPDFFVTVEFIKLVFHIDNKIRECSAKFYKSDFNENITIKKLCTLIMDDDYDISIIAPKDTIKWLNELLKVPNLYDRIKLRKKRFHASEFLMTFYPPGGKKENSDFNKSEQQDIVKFNRFLIEELYPNATPKHLCSNANLKYKCKDGMTDSAVDDIFNNLPKEMICRSLDSKTIEKIFDVFNGRAFTWVTQEFSNQDISSALGFRNRGSSKYALDKYEEAITDYNRSIELDPDSSSTFICRARAFLKIGCLSEALNDATHAYEMIRIHHSPENYIRLATIFEEGRRFDFVIYCINQYLRHLEKLEYYFDESGDLWVVKNGYKSTGFCTTGNIIQIDWLNDAEEILNRVQKQLEWDDQQQKLFPFSTVDGLRNDLSVTKKKINKTIEKLKVQNND